MNDYLENTMNYVLEAFDSANQQMKENDPSRFSAVEASEWLIEHTGYTTEQEANIEKERKERSVTDKIIDGFGQGITRGENKDLSQDINKVLDYTGKVTGLQQIVDSFGDDAKKFAKGAGETFTDTVYAFGKAAQDLHDMEVGTDSSDMQVKKRDEL